MSAARSWNRVLTHLINYDKDMPLTRLQVLLLVASNEGCLVRELVKRTGLNQSSVARNLALLGDKPVRGLKEGFKWVEMRPDEEDPRRVRCYLTPKGVTLLSEIETMME